MKRRSSPHHKDLRGCIAGSGRRKAGSPLIETPDEFRSRRSVNNVLPRRETVLPLLPASTLHRETYFLDHRNYEGDVPIHRAVPEATVSSPSSLDLPVSRSRGTRPTRRGVRDPITPLSPSTRSRASSPRGRARRPLRPSFSRADRGARSRSGSDGPPSGRRARRPPCRACRQRSRLEP